MNITIEFFGAFREYGDNLTISLPNNATIQDIRPLIKGKINAPANLLEASRFATATAILPEDYALTNGDIITIIPPVAGG